MSLFRELRRRNVIRVAIAYLAGAWLLTEVAGTVLPAFGYGEAELRVIIIILAVLLVPVLVFSWAFEITPEGLKREVNIDREHSITRFTGKKIDRIIMVLLALALGFFMFDRFVLVPRQQMEVAEQARQEGAKQARVEARLEELGDQSLAVLPFVNRSGQTEDDALAFGLHDELLTNLNKVPTAKVISMASMLKYQGGDIPIREIAKELAVATILQGSIQRSGNRVRVQVQLVNPHTNENLWADTFDRDYTREDLFAIQSGIAINIAGALDAELSPEVETRLLEPSTGSLEASEHYWNGQRLMATRKIDDLKQARKEFEIAVEVDPDYALAWVGVADSIMLLASRGEIQPLIDAVEESQNAVERALAIDDQLGEAYASLGGSLVRLVGNFRREDLRDEAYAAFDRAIELSPNYAPAYHWYAGMLDTYFESEKSLELLRKATDLDPRSSIVQYTLSIILRELGQPDEALEIMYRVVHFDPGFALAYVAVGSILAEQGRLAEAIAWYRESERLDPRYWLTWRKQTEAYLALEDYEGLAGVRARLDQHRGEDDFLGFVSDFWFNFDRVGWQGTLDWLESPPEKWSGKRWPNRIMNKFYVYAAARDFTRAYDYLLERDPRWVDPDEWRGLIIIQRNGAPDAVIFDPMDSCVPAGVFIGVGENALGRALLAESIEILQDEMPPFMEDAHRFHALGMCYLIDGSHEKALDFFEQWVAHGHFSDPAWIWMRQMPWWDPVRDHPRFIAMMQRVDDMKAEQRELLRGMELNGELDRFPAPPGS